jgi:phosphoribosylanthranilate isomerase
MRVGLFVDVGDEELRAVLRDVALDLIQLHGNETPHRAAAIRAMTGLPVMKVLRIAAAADLQPLAEFESVAERILFDTRLGEEPTGGTGKSFDWKLLQGVNFTKPWMLAGGLRAANLAEAVQVTGARIVDVSSGVEDPSGHKDPAKIREFIALAKNLA